MALVDDQSAPPAERAARLLERGPATSARSPLGSAGRALRQAILRLVRPYAAYQRSVDEELLAAVGEVSERLRALDAEEGFGDAVGREEQLLGDVLRVAEDLNRRVAHLEDVQRGNVERFDAVDERLEEATRIVDASRALPYVAGDAFSVRTEAGVGRVLGYADAAGDGGGYRSFEDVFRGPEDRVRAGQEPYLEILGDRRPVLDAGCGRGEFLDLLRERGIPVLGVDSDPDMVAAARERGHDEVVEGDLVELLESRPDGELGAIFSAQVVEHLPYRELVRFIALARAKLAPGGVFVAETVNPHAPHALKTFWTDPTHHHPLFPEVMLALCRTAGFESAYVFHPLGTGDVEADRFEQDAYAVVASRAAE